MSLGDLSWWLDLAPTLKWKVAETMPDAPHSYVVRGKTLKEEDFDRAVKVIRTYGVPGKFYDRTNIYLADEKSGLKWWTMGAPLADTIIINQAEASRVYGKQDAPDTRSKHFSVYDSLAVEYDARYASSQALAENAMVRGLLFSLIGQEAVTVLDVGCGTGLALDMGLTSPKLYVGVDPSQAMLNELVRKHPKVRRLYPQLAEEAMPQLGKVSFDLVISLFGSPSYVAPSTLVDLPLLANRAVVLMHYRQGYAPDYEVDKVDFAALDASREAAGQLVREYGGYQLWLNRFVISVIERG